MNIVYPVLIGEIAKRGIKKTAIAKCLNISEKSLYNKLNGLVSFTWNEVCTSNRRFFPDMEPMTLFAKAQEKEETSA